MNACAHATVFGSKLATHLYWGHKRHFQESWPPHVSGEVFALTHLGFGRRGVVAGHGAKQLGDALGWQSRVGVDRTPVILQLHASHVHQRILLIHRVPVVQIRARR